mmetsp:Transcript_6402/g.10115  ORF Transcript_6402/g.10115 Transcript_6402/m.10115 type:complete len:112 (-) Transcript_6402:35-370(-)
MCGAYVLQDGKPLSHYNIVDGSVIHPLYERYGDSLDAGARMLADPDWYRQQASQAKQMANTVSSWDWSSMTTGWDSATKKAYEYLGMSEEEQGVQGPGGAAGASSSTQNRR